jgi:hypothetical protein
MKIDLWCGFNPLARRGCRSTDSRLVLIFVVMLSQFVESLVDHFACAKGDRIRALLVKAVGERSSWSCSQEAEAG